MEVTQEQIDAMRANLVALNQAIDDGVRSVTIGAQTITYNTTASLITARDDLKTRLNEAEASFAGTKQRGRITYLQYGGRGY